MTTIAVGADSKLTGSIVKDVKATATTEVKTGQRRVAASELEPTA